MHYDVWGGRGYRMTVQVLRHVASPFRAKRCVRASCGRTIKHQVLVIGTEEDLEHDCLQVMAHARHCQFRTVTLGA